ncbi:metallophosphoesterase family protein [Hydrogenophaga soli]
MRIAILSDIHGNLHALQAVLADVDAQGVSLIVNAGDSLSGPLMAAATGDMLMTRRIPMIAGNHERQLLSTPVHQLGASDACAANEISDAHRAWLASAPATLWLTPEVFVCHGTPHSDLQYWLETVTPDHEAHGAPGVRAATPSEVRSRLGQGLHTDRASLIVCGHTHVQRVVTLKTSQKAGAITVVNPGSVGLPAYDDNHPFVHRIEAGSPHARYALAQQTPVGWQVDLRCVPYDVEPMAQLAEQRGRADWATALRTGAMG